VEEWRPHVDREIARYRDGEQRLPEANDADQRQRQLTRIGNAAYGAGLALLMQGRSEQASEWFDRAARRYRESAEDAPAGSWGRPIGAMKARIMAGDWAGAEREARWALDLDAAASDSPIGKYCASLAFLVLEEDDQARIYADELRTRDDFAPAAVGDALAMIAAGTDAIGYIEAVEAVLESFETRDEHLEDVPVADTVLVLQALAERRDLTADLSSPLLPD
jgi:tetratricopeptide (TPR) repeat protein